MVNKDQAKGKAEEVGGKVEKAAGDLTGSEDMKARGEAKELKGKARQSAGDIKEGAHEAADRVRDAGRDLKS
jgi:uncharacterized protein YjbJ (UPF0337 family)